MLKSNSPKVVSIGVATPCIVEIRKSLRWIPRSAMYDMVEVAAAATIIAAVQKPKAKSQRHARVSLITQRNL
jgi:hypothetical protein